MGFAPGLRMAALVLFAAGAAQALEATDPITFYLRPHQKMDGRWPDQYAAGMHTLVFQAFPKDPPPGPQFKPNSAEMKDDGGLKGFKEVLNAAQGALYSRPSNAGDVEARTYKPKFRGLFDVEGEKKGTPPTWAVDTRVTVRKIGVTQDPDLWWFNGVPDPAGYHSTATLAVTGGEAGGEYHWRVEKGEDKVDLVAGNKRGREVKTAENTVTVASKAASAEATSVQKDISIRVEHKGEEFIFETVVFTPFELERTGQRHSARGRGYESTITYMILDQFKRVLPRDVPWNEDVDDSGGNSNPHGVSDWTIANGRQEDENWPWAEEVGIVTRPNAAADTIVVPGWAALQPRPQNPPQPPAEPGKDKIDHSVGSLYVGSTEIAKGVRVKRLTWQRYLDHADHE